jgi:thiol-disulfide isomerase/thioredoxin
MDKSTLITIAVIIVVLVCAGMYTYVVQNDIRTTERDSAASQTLSSSEETPYTDLEGNPFTFDAYRGQVRVVNSWASWCPFCTQELADFQKLAEEYAEQNVAVIAINRKEPKERASAYLASVGDFSAIHFAVDLTDAYYVSIGGFSMPETVFYDVDGNITFHKRGIMDIEEMRMHTQEALTAVPQ